MIQSVNLSILRDAISKRREIDRLDLRTLHTKTGVHYATLSRFLRGGAPDITTFCRLCFWADVDPRTLYVTPKIRNRKGHARS